MCTRVLWNSNDLAVLTGRSMDWPESTQPLIVAFPPGRQREGFAPAGIADDPNLAVDPYDETLVGDITDRFVPREMAF